jgi:hypothetical protein
MHDIILFVAAICFIVVALPIIQTLSDIVCGFGQWIISAINVHVISNNVKSQDMQEVSNSQAIGFQVPSDDSDDYEVEPDEEDKIHIGFRG